MEVATSGQIEVNHSSVKEMTILMKKNRCNGSKRWYINSDIVGEILFRLPYKSLPSAKLVCKSWNSFTKSPQFYRTYRRINKHNNPPHFLVLKNFPRTTIILHRMGRDRFIPIEPAVSIPNCYNSVVSSSYGLVCIHGINFGQNLAVFNPTSNELFPLPDLPHRVFAFIPEDVDVNHLPDHDIWDDRYLNVISFGYHPPTNQYKVIQLLRDPAGCVTKCYVLSISRRSDACCWREIEESLMCQVMFHMPSAFCIDGVIYWENFTSVRESIEIVSFDLGTEKLNLVQSPWRCESKDTPQPTRHLVELENKLCFVKTKGNKSYNGEQLHQMDIWMLMKGDNVGDLKSWTHMHRLELGPCPHVPHYVPPLIACLPLCVDHNNNRILLYDQANYDHPVMYSYHLTDKIFKKYDADELYDDDELPVINRHMSTYYESVVHTNALVSLY